MRLNNVLASILKTRKLTWDDDCRGPLHAPTWTSIAYLNNVEWGRGTGPNRGAAREEAAKTVLEALVADGLISNV
ncbi:hypothetical protein OE88DRAFT_1733552 [Heliocybe sulcata]|uniref:DRBM domain-containing protein n=1 Tax=Heliocybe sulcata TaxID=5364 RepID=A0A5C3N8L4_9AGAM|nr:hypothetical protein OE88DRAFT_1733552 [Heliocybe sulcata]